MRTGRWALLLCFGAGLFAQTSPQEAAVRQLRDRLKGNIVTLRVFDRRDTIHFSPDGEPEKDPKLGVWTWDSKVSVSDVSSSQEGIEISGTRLYVTFNHKDNDKPVYVNSKNKVKLILA